MGQRTLLVRAVASGLDHRWWQSAPSTTVADNAHADRRGAMVKMRGWYDLVDWTSAWSPAKAHPAMGVFDRENTEDLLVEHQGSIWLVVGKTRYEVLADRHSTTLPSEASWMTMVGQHLYICNGRDRNQKYDGRKATPVGIERRPEAPVAILVDVTADITTPGGTASPVTTGVIEASSDASLDRLQYAYTWVNEAGAESNLGGWSAAVIPSSDNEDFFVGVYLAGDAPSDDCVSRNLYRTTDGGNTRFFIRRVPGQGDAFVQDHVGIGDEVDRIAPGERENDAPEPAWFAFEFRGRAYYQPASRPSQLDFSKVAQPESVPLGNSVDVGDGDGDRITAYSMAEDYVLLFKERSVYTLTTGSDGLPIVRRLSNATGCRSRFGVQSYEGKTYWLDRDGIYATNGASVRRLTDVAQREFQNMPARHLNDVVSWVEEEPRLVVFVAPKGPRYVDQQLMMVQVDSGLMTTGDAVSVASAATYQGRVLLSANHPGTAASYEIVAQQHGDEREGESFDGAFQTQWFDMEDPTSDKAVTRFDLVYSQRCDATLTVEVYTDWDERSSAWSGTVSLIDPTAPVFDTATYTAGSTYDLERMRTTRVDVTPPAGTSRIQGRSFAIRVSSTSDNEPWSIVGFRVYYDDLGRPSHGGLDQDGTC